MKDWKIFATRYGGLLSRLGSSVAQCLGPGQGERRGAVLPAVLREGEVARELPLPLGQRLWYLVPVTATWIAGALLRYRRRRAGVQLNVRSLIRRRRWSRIVLAQAAWAMLCALLIAQIPWEEKMLPQILSWAGLAPTFATIWFDRKKPQ
ncbi:hypothetical protein [Streptomyces sp. NEAU-L66]|uniref:hypothetical protein n=1 Tax=Streptomyces sp. NEAU-L66 TaxID=3390812 RepID=UPI0039C65E94